MKFDYLGKKRGLGEKMPFEKKAKPKTGQQIVTRRVSNNVYVKKNKLLTIRSFPLQRHFIKLTSIHE
jgi:hypothetical protein